eukprot:g49721.t1
MIPSSVRAVTRKHVSNFSRSNQLGLNRSPTALAHRPTNIGLRQRHFSSDNRPHPNVPRHYRLETRSFSSLTVRQQVESWRRWLSENSPKGFKNFYSENKGNSSNNSGSSNSGGGNKKGDNFPSGSDILMGAVGFAFISWLFVNQLWSDGKEITWQQFRTKYLDQGRVMSIEVFNKELAKVTLVDSKERPYFMIGSVDSFESNLTHAQEALGVAPEDFIDVTYSGTPNLLSLLPAALMIAFMIHALSTGRNSGGLGGIGGMGGKRGIFNIGKANPKVVKPGEQTKVKFDDVAGLDEAKVEIREFVEFLKNPQKFRALGAKIPKGGLLEGPPGTGKTLLAKAVAGEASVPFFSMSGADFIEMFVGVGPSRVRDLFAEARENAPCIIWIDEIDAVGAKRTGGQFSGGHSERDNTLNQLLVEMDGFSSTENVVVLAGTNRKDILDKALLRPGRLDRHINVGLPDIRGREQIFEVHLKPIKISYKKNDLAKRLAALTPGFSGADIANLANEAALIAARKDKQGVELVDFEAAADRVIGGLEKQNHTMTQREKELVAYHESGVGRVSRVRSWSPITSRELVAYHESGHAVCGWFLEHASPLLKVTVVPRASGALGFAQYLPNELALYQKDQLFHMSVMALGGRAAEEVFFGKISTGAADDLRKVTAIASSQIIHYYDPNDQFKKPFSETTGQMIDEEVREMVAMAYTKAVELVKEKKEVCMRLAQRLLKDETVNHDVLLEILGDRPFKSDAYRSYLEEKFKKDDKPAAEGEDGTVKAEAASGESSSSGSSSSTNAADASSSTPEAEVEEETTTKKKEKASDAGK